MSYETSSLKAVVYLNMRRCMTSIVLKLLPPYIAKGMHQVPWYRELFRESLCIHNIVIACSTSKGRGWIYTCVSILKLNIEHEPLTAF